MRVHGEHNKARSWMMKKEALSGLKPDQIKWGYLADKWEMTNLKAGDRVIGGLPR